MNGLGIERGPIMAEIGGKNEGALIAALAAGRSIQEAARLAGLSERTVYRRRQKPEFMAEVGEARAALVSEAVGLLARSAPTAVEVLMKLLSASSDAIRLSAVRCVLDHVVKLREHADLDERIARLERSFEKFG